SGSSTCENDGISVAALGTLFQEDFPELGSRTSGSGSVASEKGAGEPVSAAIRTAPGLLLDALPAQSGPSSAFFRHCDAEAAFVVPPTAESVQELNACWMDGVPTADGRALAAMHEASKFGLGRIPHRICHCLSYYSS
ncbi:hypothetical protein GOODEAATRI_029681, partial [Goodea atripinnis]